MYFDKLINVAYFSKLDDYSDFQGTALIGASTISVLQVRMPDMLLLFMTGR
jgi:hypothetical protein